MSATRQTVDPTLKDKFLGGSKSKSKGLRGPADPGYWEREPYLRNPGRVRLPGRRGPKPDLVRGLFGRKKRTKGKK